MRHCGVSYSYLSKYFIKDHFIYTLASSLGGGANRPRSKTFEEYEKETSDIWNDGEEDLANLTLEAELDFAPEREGMAEGGGGGEGQARRGAGQSQLKTKGKGEGVICIPLFSSY